jgi:XTP/dITP diphosphohydrolase
VRPTLLIATTNAGKFREFGDLLGDLPIDLCSLADYPGAPLVPEDGVTYLANALQKAVTIARWSKRATLADDSGLEVDALHGAPGLRSARYAGSEQDSRANVVKLLGALVGVPAAARSARFHCVICVAAPDGATLVTQGACAGRITEQPLGSDGFGYDPVFLYPPAGLTFAQMPAAEKNKVSHRARACAEVRGQLLPFLEQHS